MFLDFYSNMIILSLQLLINILLSNPKWFTFKKLVISLPGAFFGTFLLNGLPGAFFGTFNN